MVNKLHWRSGDSGKLSRGFATSGPIEREVAIASVTARIATVRVRIKFFISRAVRVSDTAASVKLPGLFDGADWTTVFAGEICFSKTAEIVVYACSTVGIAPRGGLPR